MKRALFAIAGLFGIAFAGQPAHAADYTTAAAYSWSGSYLGATIGILKGEARWYTIVPAVTSPYSSDTGLLGGITAGHNWQNGNWVYGVEADWSWSNFDAGPMAACGGGCMTGIDWLATLRGRVGYANGATLFYATGGGAFGRVASRLTAVPGSAVASTEGGWTLGGGVEIKFSQNWSAKAEYLHVWLNDAVSCTAAVCAGVTNYADPGSIHVLRLGVNYTLY